MALVHPFRSSIVCLWRLPASCISKGIYGSFSADPLNVSPIALPRLAGVQVDRGLLANAVDHEQVPVVPQHVPPGARRELEARRHLAVGEPLRDRVDREVLADGARAAACRSIDGLEPRHPARCQYEVVYPEEP